jgi:hypothetical protein
MRQPARRSQGRCQQPCAGSRAKTIRRAAAAPGPAAHLHQHRVAHKLGVLLQHALVGLWGEMVGKGKERSQGGVRVGAAAVVLQRARTSKCPRPSGRVLR